MLAASDTGAKGKLTGFNNFFTQGEGDSSQRLCFRCGETGHYKIECPKEEDSSQIRGRRRQQRGTSRCRQRDKPKYRRFHCVYHNDTTDRYCSTHNSNDLKKFPYEDRFKQLNDNGDCGRCVGYCPKGSY